VSASDTIVAGVDVGTECVKAVVLDGGRRILGRTVVPSTGYFQGRIKEALTGALEEAGEKEAAVARTCVTGFGARCADVPNGMFFGEASCHARGATYHFRGAQTLVDLGGRSPTVIRIDDEGLLVESHSGRKCAVGIGSFMDSAAHRLDVHPTHLMELAAAAERPASVNSYCTVFAESEILEQLRGGATREQVALGCLYSVADRVLEIGHLVEPVVVCGGIAEYYPGVLAVLESKAGMVVKAVPQPIMCGAFGAALLALESWDETQPTTERVRS
jgi:predicted CoA-substrate-specific enzyme activase